MYKKEKLILLVLSLLGLLTIIFVTPQNSIFGSNTDWFSQHVQIGDVLRNLIYEKNTLLPDYIASLGGGQNVYAFSYYGLFRLDILISLLLPFISMKDIIIVYMAISFIASLNLCYIWIRRHDFPIHIAIFCSLLLCFSSFLFHSHRQIMFVNYMPWLFLALLSTDYYLKKAKTSYLVISIIMIITHSYFFSVSALFVLLIYVIYQCKLNNIALLSKQSKKVLLHFIKAIMIAIMISAILLLPTALVMLENTKSVASTTLQDILLPTFKFDGLLYDNYGCGLTLISWLLLSLGLAYKKTRGLSLFFICASIFPIVAYILNGTLYVRYKVFLTFIPLILLLMAEVLQAWKNRQIKINIYILSIMLFPIFFLYKQSWIWIDLILGLIALYFYQSKQKSSILALSLFIPLYVCSMNNNLESYVTKKKYTQIQSIKEDAILNSYLNDFVRIDDFRSPLATSNLSLPSMNKTTMYTSITNTKYNTFYYDILKNAIPIRNRVACLSQENPFFQGLMGVKYLYSNKSNIPIGYKVVEESNNIRILENNNVKPLAYATNNLFNEKAFDKLNYPYTLDTIYNNAIVANGNHSYESKMKKTQYEWKLINKSENINFFNIGKDIRIESKGNNKLQLKTQQNLKDEILLIQFNLKDISNHDKFETTISINDIKNRLSSAKASYPNNNFTFTYILSSAADWNELNMEFSKGDYTLSDITVYSIPYSELNTKNTSPLEMKEVHGNEIIKGSIKVLEKNSYFVTSLPYQKGYEAYVDGIKTPIELVNKAFVGFPIKQGNHEIIICFTPPGKTISLYISSLGVILLIINLLYERKRENICPLIKQKN